MAETIYVLCALSSAMCAFLLFRQYRTTHSGLIFWSGWCFGGLTVNNFLLVADLVVFPTQTDLSVPRTVVALASLAALLFGFIWESR